MNWNDYPNFSKSEFDCKHTGRNEMRPEFLERLQELRNRYGRPIIISSGYRDPSHPVEAKKASPGTHSLGLACDIACQGEEAYKILKLAFELGFCGIGIKQHGTGRFIHLDMAAHPFARPNLWSYA